MARYNVWTFHKDIIDNCPPFRPILTATNTSTYNLAKFLVPILIIRLVASEGHICFR